MHPTRDFSYAEDTVRGFIAVTVADQSLGEVINVGSGFEISTSNLMDLIAEVMGVKVFIETAEERMRPEKNEFDCFYTNISKAEDFLGSTSTHEEEKSSALQGGNRRRVVFTSLR